MGKCRQGCAHGLGLQVKLRRPPYKLNQSLSLVTAWCIRFSQEPADQSVVLGERVVLSCVVFNYSGIVQWTKDGLALGVGEGLRGEHGLRQLCTSRGVLCKKKKNREEEKCTCVSPRCRRQCEVERAIKSATVSGSVSTVKALTKAFPCLQKCRGHFNIKGLSREACE